MRKGFFHDKKRQDAWTEEEDLLLAETVLRHVREGSTQLNAFEEVGDKLNRTSAACGFRWNAVVRQQYEESLQMAKSSENNGSAPLEINTHCESGPFIHHLFLRLKS